jgi:hypothetical protein
MVVNFMDVLVFQWSTCIHDPGVPEAAGPFDTSNFRSPCISRIQNMTIIRERGITLYMRNVTPFKLRYI